MYVLTDLMKMLPPNAICVSQEGPVNALALNKDCSQVVIAGRNVFKVFSIGDNEFSEVCNLRVGKNLSLNFSSIDVAWSNIEENTLATAATNGAVVVWNLGRSGRSKQEHVFSDHKRTVNKVSFHLTEPALLISGSQDGMMKCFDLRMKEVARTFLSNTESIRDVQFSPHQAHTFAAVSENGSVQVWDVRRAERCLQQFTAHSGPIFACDWHPELPWLATASRDKTIKVWDLQEKPTLVHTIYTIASVGHVKWRPQKKFHVASCALVLDSTVSVWDVRRPHVPLAMFAEHRDVTTAIAWHADPDVFLSTSRDSTLYRHRFRDAAHPVLWANPHGVCVSARGHVTHAASRRPLPAHPAAHTPAHAPAARPILAGANLFRKHPRAGSLTAVAQLALERAFPCSAASSLTRYVSSAEPAPVACARRYRLAGAPAHVLAAHNADVARELQRHMVAHVWDVVCAVYSSRGQEAAPRPPPPASREPEPHPTPSFSNSMEEEPLEPVEEWSDSQFHNSGVLGLPTQTIYIPPAKAAQHGADESGWVSAASAHYVDIDAADWSLPEEAFPPPAPHSLHHHPQAATATASASPGAASTTSGSSAADPARHAPADKILYSQQSSVTTVEDGEVGPLRVRTGAAPHVPLDTAPLLAAALRMHADLGDVQTAACVMLALGDHRSDLFPYIDEAMQEQWLFGYIELLQRHKLWNLATEVVRSAWVYSVWQWSQQSSTVQMCCARCGRQCRPGHSTCDRCHTLPSLCAVCHRMVRGLYAWCQGCAHGGHLHHMHEWMSNHKLCPAGCGHHCQLP